MIHCIYVHPKTDEQPAYLLQEWSNEETKNN